VKRLEIVVTETDEGLRLDRFLTRRVETMGRAQASRLIAQGKVTVDGAFHAKGDTVHRGQRVALEELPTPKQFEAAPDTDLTLAIAYEDSYLVVVDKPAGVPSYPLRPDESGTVAGALLARYRAMARVGFAPQQAGLIHRLDTGTSGLMVAAKNREVFRRLSAALKAGEIDKRYMALCQGHVLAPQTIDAWIVSGRSDNRKVRVAERPTKRGRAARTELLVATPVDELSLVEARATAAARHQIRAHLAWLGHPLVGDILYGGPPLAGLKRHFLHASELAFTHPITRQRIRVHSPLADDLRVALDARRPAG
jgi:23S rRNA pseudouridine1911/1915/1917 synthase